MKKAFSFAIILVAAAIAVAVVSCKKDTQNATSNPKNQSAQAFDPSHITDMNAYLKDFKKKMQTSAEHKDGETLSIEEAAWHLSSVANYDFANANVEFDDLRFDTLYGTVAITGGSVLLSDLAVVYESISTNIDMFYHGLALENKHFRFIDVTISEDGSVVVSLTTTFLSGSKWHYFSDGSFCDEYFSNNIQYTANDVAVSVLNNYINLVIGHEENSNTGRVYYVETRRFRFKYYEWYEDPDNYCPNSNHSRLYCSCHEFAWPIPKDHMCYYFDSYLGLAYENITHAAPEVIRVVVNFHKAWNVPDGINEPLTGNHSLDVFYGFAVASQENNY